MTKENKQNGSTISNKQDVKFCSQNHSRVGAISGSWGKTATKLIHLSNLTDLPDDQLMCKQFLLMEKKTDFVFAINKSSASKVKAFSLWMMRKKMLVQCAKFYFSKASISCSRHYSK